MRVGVKTKTLIILGHYISKSCWTSGLTLKINSVLYRSLTIMSLISLRLNFRYHSLVFDGFISADHIKVIILEHPGGFNWSFLFDRVSRTTIQVIIIFKLSLVLSISIHYRWHSHRIGFICFSLIKLDRMTIDPIHHHWFRTLLILLFEGLSMLNLILNVR